MTKKQNIKHFKSVIVNYITMLVLEDEMEPESARAYLYGYNKALHDNNIIKYNMYVLLNEYINESIAEATIINREIEENETEVFKKWN